MAFLFTGIVGQNVPESPAAIRQFCALNPPAGTWERYSRALLNQLDTPVTLFFQTEPMIVAFRNADLRTETNKPQQRES